MKGPGLRLKGDVRRIWRCPVCGIELPAAGRVASLRCECEKPHPFMQLVEPRRRAPHQAEPLDVYFECAPDDDESTATAPVGEQTDPVSPDEIVNDFVDENDSAADSILEDAVVADEVVTFETLEEDIPDVEPEEEPPLVATGAVDPPPPPPTAAAPAAGPPTEADDSDHPERQRKRRSRGGRRKRGRRRKADSGQNSGPESRPADS